MAGAGQAKTLVYCSEGSPEGFDPAPWTAGTTFDAASRPDLRPADRVQEGLDRDRARPRRELGGLRGRHRDHLPPAPGGEVPDHGLVHADPRDERRRRGLHLHAPVRQGPAPGTSTRRASPGSTSTRRWRPSLKEIVKVDDMTVKFVLSRPDATVLADLPDGLRLDRLQGVRRPARGGRHQGAVQRPAGRHRAVHLRRLPAGRGDPLPGQSRLVERQAADRRPDLRDHRRRRACASRSWSPANATSSPIRTRPTSRG